MYNNPKSMISTPIFIVYFTTIRSRINGDIDLSLNENNHEQ